MRMILSRLNIWPIRQRAAALEALVYLLVVAAWLVISPAESAERLIVGNLVVAAPAAAAVLQTFFSLPSLGPQTRRIWLFLGLALVGWTLRHLIWILFALILQSEPSALSIADLFGLIAYPLAIFGLLRFTSSFRHAPLRFRFLLDMLINSGVVMTLGWLFLGQTNFLESVQFIPVIYPIADLILLMTIVNLALADRIPKLTALILGISVLGLAASDYAYSFLSLYDSYRIGTVTSLGWIIAYLLLGNEAIRERQRSEITRLPPRQRIVDLGTQLQNILPVTLVLALIWFVLTDWRMRGQLSSFGFLMSAFFSIILIVRLGIRAGEVELYRYWQLFSNLAEPALICDVKGKIMLGNPALAQLSGPEENEISIVGKSLFSLFSAETLPAKALDHAARHAVTLEVVLSQSLVPYSLTLSPIFSEGRRVMVAGVAHDLSEQIQQQNAIRRAYEELQMVHQQLGDLNMQLEARVEERTRTLSDAYRQLEDQHRALQELDRLKSDFVSMVSHELRTPLNNLGGGVELLMSRNRAGRSDRGTLNLMQAEIQRLSRFVENILNLSALDAGRLTFHPVPLSLSVVVSELLHRRLRGPGMERIIVRVSPDLPLVLADETALQSVLHHLIDNALKYASSGPVIIEAILEKRRVRLQVTDHGKGIPPDKRHLLFQRFQRLDVRDSQSVYGYGLGLYLSHRLVEAMNGDLKFASPAGAGAQFYFHLKVAK